MHTDKIALVIRACFIISLVFLVLGFVFWRGWASYEKKRKRFRATEGIFRPFYCLAIGVFFAGVSIFFPAYFFNYLNGEQNAVTVIKSIGLAVHNTMRMFIMDGEFEPIREIIDYSVENAEGVLSPIIGKNLRNPMSVYGISLFLIAPVVTFSTVISCFKNFISKFAYKTTGARQIYVMSELNERSLALAENIVLHSDNRKPKLVIFADVFENGDEMSELVTKAQRLGAICFSCDISEITLKPYISRPNKIERRVFFISMDEDNNLERALEYIPTIRRKKRYNNKNTSVYVFAKSAESEALLDSVNHGNIRVRRIDENRNFAIDVIRKYPIFERATENNGVKVMNVAIIGLGTIGTELLKTVVWSGQMIGYELNLHVFHSGDDAEENLRAIAPELVSLNQRHVQEGRVPGYPYYRIFYHNNTDVKSAAFLDEIKKSGQITTAYVTLGDDELNIETAMRLRMNFARDGYSGASAPQIIAVVFSDVKAEAISRGNGLTTVDASSYREIKRVAYDIEIVGTLSSINSLDMIEQRDLEERALDCHLSYDRKKRWALIAEREAAETALACAEGEKREDLVSLIGKLNQGISDKEADAELSEARFWSFEYYRNSSKSTALHIELKENYCPIDSDTEDPKLVRELKCLEHERWYAYMIVEGYVFGENKDFIAKTNNKIIPTHMLPESELEIDNMELPKKAGERVRFEKWLEDNAGDLSGKTVAITGSTGGLGKDLCRYLASLGANLILVDRNHNRSDKNRRSLINAFPNIKVRCVNADLSDISSVKVATDKLKLLKPDVFIHNAGAYSIPRHKTALGYDNVFTINFISPYYMIRELMPVLKENGGRVVVVGSIAHNYSKTDDTDVDFSTRKAASKVYGNAKRYLMFSLHELFKDEKDVSLAITHPGITFTNITAHYPPLIYAIIKRPMKLIFMNPDKAALSILRGVFEKTEYHAWIGPSLFGIWGLPRKTKLTTCKVEESLKIAEKAEQIYAECKAYRT